MSFSDRIENDPELRVVFLLELIKFAREVGVGREHLPGTDEGPHDFDVEVNGEFAVEDA
jgi:hypothetical protein